MKKLTNVYIKATKGNVKELNVLLKKHIKENDCLLFEGDCIETLYAGIPNGQQKISLTELKRLIDTIPTREEIKRLKAQISAYKMNYDKVVKHSLSKEDVIDDLQKDLSFAISEHNAESKINAELSSKNNSLQNLYDDALKEIEVWKDNDKKSLELIKEINDDNEYLSELYFDLLNENEQLKQRKWWQTWK